MLKKLKDDIIWPVLYVYKKNVHSTFDYSIIVNI